MGTIISRLIDISKEFGLWQGPQDESVGEYEPKADEEMGMSGLNFFQPGYIQEEKLPALFGRRGWLAYREMMDNDPVIATVMSLYGLYVRYVDWYSHPPVNEDKVIEAAVFLDQNMNDMVHPWHVAVGDASTAFGYGFAPLEIVYRLRKGRIAGKINGSKFNDGNIGWKKLGIRAQDTIDHWQVSPHGEVLGLWQMAPPNYQMVFIPIEKIVNFTTQPFRASPEGRSILRPCYLPYRDRKKLNNLRNVIIERGGLGFVVMRAPSKVMGYKAVDPTTNTVIEDSTKKSELAKVKTMLKNIKIGNQSYAIIPSDFTKDGHPEWDLDLKTVDANALVGHISDAISEKTYEILMSVITEFSALGSKSAGSWALARDKRSSFTMAMTAHLDGFEATINTQLVPRLFELNTQFDIEVLPECKHLPVEDVDMTAIAQILTLLPRVGFDISDQPDILNAILKALGLPEKTSDDNVAKALDKLVKKGIIKPTDKKKNSKVVEKSKRKASRNA